MASSKVLTATTIALINVAAICNIKNFPLLAEYGSSVLFFLALSALFFFIPVALVSAELASGWPDRGVYSWVKEAFGKHWGFLAIWLQWISNVIWYPTILSFIVSTLAYLFDPALATSKPFVMGAIIAIFWSTTLLNFQGMRLSGLLSSAGALVGTIVPIALIIGLGGYWIGSGRPVELEFSWRALFPDLTSFNQLVLLSGVLLGLAGMEMSAVHAREVENPRKNYPKAIFLATVLILLFSSLGALAIGAVVPREKIQLAAGGMEAFSLLFQALGIPWATPLIAAVTLFGALGMMSTWIVGPSRGLLATALDKELPPLFATVNKAGMPVAILLIQALIVTALSFVFLFMPSVNSSYWALVALASILYMLMYVLMFAAAIRLRYTQPKVPRTYEVPGGKRGLVAVAVTGGLGASFGLFVSFFPPAQIDTGALWNYELFMIGASLLFCLLPLFLYRRDVK
jgi:putative glutamate/gamma-aminobutyrate antiporter